MSLADHGGLLIPRTATFFQGSGYRALPCPPGFYVGAGDISCGSHAYMSSTSSAETSLSLSLIYLKDIVLIQSDSFKPPT